MGSPRKTAVVVGAAGLWLLGLVPLFVGVIFFAYTNYCEDTCDKPPWNFWSALGNALPWVIAGVLLLSCAAYMLLIARGRTDRTFGRAVTAAVLLSAAAIPVSWFAWLIRDGLGVGAGLVAGALCVAAAWFALRAWSRPTPPNQ
jgi:hypothetical protein